MTRSTNRTRLVTVGSLMLAGSVSFADGLRFSAFTPLASSSGPTADESMPITFGNPAFSQQSIADRQTQLGAQQPNSGNWDMLTINETGPHKGRYLFTVFETSQSGVQRQDLLTGEVDTIWQTPTNGGAVNFDASFWTPWGTYITAEESWTSPGQTNYGRYGRLFEFRNPTEAPGISTPLAAGADDGADFVHQNVIWRSSKALTTSAPRICRSRRSTDESTST